MTDNPFSFDSQRFDLWLDASSDTEILAALELFDASDVRQRAAYRIIASESDRHGPGSGKERPSLVAAAQAIIDDPLKVVDGHPARL